MLGGSILNMTSTSGYSSIIYGVAEKKSKTLSFQTMIFLSVAEETSMWKDLPARGAHATSWIEP